MEEGSLTGKGFAFAAMRNWMIAAVAADRAQATLANGPPTTTPDTVVAIIMGTVAAETFINEFPEQLRFLVPQDPQAPYWRNIADGIESLEEGKSEIKSKYYIASLLLPGGALNKGEQAWEEFVRLVDVRNKFVHMKVQQFEIDPDLKPHKWNQWFAQRGWTITSVSGGQLVGWENQIQTPEIARWACRASARIIVEIIKRMSDSTGTVKHISYDMLLSHWNEALNEPRIKELPR